MSKRPDKAGKGGGAMPPPKTANEAFARLARETRRAGEWQGSQSPPSSIEGANHRLVLDQLAEGWVSGAQKGSTQEARTILEIASAHLRRGWDLPKALSIFLADRIEDILDAEEPWGQPLLKRVKGQKSVEESQRNDEIGKEYWIYTKALGWKGTAAAKHLAQEYGVSENVVKHAWRKYRPRVSAMSDEYLEWLKREAREIYDKGEK